MIKKLFVYNQLVFGFILIGLFIFPRIIFKYSDNNTELIEKPGNIYEIYFINPFYIICPLHGKIGGIISANKIQDINTLSQNEIEDLIDNKLDFNFTTENVPNTDFLCIGDYDFDKNIEIIAFEPLGIGFMHPIEITKNGELKEENFFTCPLIYFLTSFWMLPNFIICIIFFLYYFIVCIIYVITCLSKRRKTINWDNNI